MKNKINIIQSYSILNEKVIIDNEYLSRLYLNLYIFLLSYLTLNKYYGKVTVYCNKLAYDNLIKYIPYDEIVLLENKYSGNQFLWNHYKLSVIEKLTEPFIHVDSDVFIFDRLFDKFINGKKYDVMVQDITSGENIFEVISDFYLLNGDVLLENGLIDKDYINGFTSCGVMGFNKPEIINEYNKHISKFMELYHNGKFIVDIDVIGWLSEEYSMYNLSTLRKYNVYPILPQNLIKKHGIHKTADIVKYTHLWNSSKFNADVIESIKGKIYRDFPKHYYLVENYDMMINRLK